MVGNTYALHSIYVPSFQKFWQKCPPNNLDLATALFDHMVVSNNFPINSKISRGNSGFPDYIGTCFGHGISPKLKRKMAALNFVSTLHYFQAKITFTFTHKLFRLSVTCQKWRFLIGWYRWKRHMKTEKSRFHYKMA